MWGVGVWSEVDVHIHPTGVLWDSGQDSGLAVNFWNLSVHKPFPHRPCFMAGSTITLIQTIVITELVSYSRQYPTGQNVLVSFCIQISMQYYERAKSIP
jgi:hypothetical protein